MPYSDWSKIISASVAPVVIISACGLLCLAFYNRLAAIVSRLRGFQRERLGEQELIAQTETETGAEMTRRHRLLEHLGAQIAHVTRRAKLIRLTLLFLLLAISLLIGCCAMLAMSALITEAMLVAISFFLLGLLSMLAGTIGALVELKTALQPAELENRFVSEFLQEEKPRDEDTA